MFPVGVERDPLALAPLQYAWFLDGQRDATNRQAVYPRLTPNEKTAVILVFGQSNAANWGTGYYTPVNTTKLHNLSIYDGAVYAAGEPLLGGNGSGAGFPIRLGDALITAGTYQRVILVTFGVGGASVGEWAPGGPLNHRIPVAIRRCRAQGLEPTHALWHQGETDYSLGTSRPNYLSRLNGVIATVRAEGVVCPFIVAEATWSDGETSVSVREAQAAIVNPSLGIYAGPDTDALGIGFRSDAAHFNATGLAAHAALWLPIVQGLS